MQGGTAEGMPQHQQILKIVSQSVRSWACRDVASAPLLLLYPPTGVRHAAESRTKPHSSLRHTGNDGEPGAVNKSFSACAEGGAGGADAHVSIHCCAGQGRHSARCLHRHRDAHACALAESYGVLRLLSCMLPHIAVLDSCA